MSVISHQTIEDSEQADGRRHVRYEFTDNLGDKHYRGPKVVSAGFNADADRVTMVPDVEEALALAEILDAILLAESQLLNPDKVPDHQSGGTVEEQQANFDRRVLGRCMLFESAHALYAAYPMFQAVELRGGANANQRASYLGLSVVTYNQIDARFSNVNGVAWFLADEKNQIWNDLPEGEID